VSEDRLLTADDVAELLQVPVSWVRQHTRNGDLPNVVIGRYRRYRREEIMRYIEQRSVPSRRLRAVS
jgi:excisionase family DNA binding protein